MFPFGIISLSLIFEFVPCQIKSRGPRARAIVKNAVRPKIASTYGFVLTDKINGKTARRNSKKVVDLLEGNAFHYKVCCELLNAIVLTACRRRTLMLALALHNINSFRRYFMTHGSKTSSPLVSSSLGTLSQFPSLHWLLYLVRCVAKSIFLIVY